MALAYLLYDRNFTEAERELRLALELNPRYVQARIWYAFFYLRLAVGHIEEGLAQANWLWNLILFPAMPAPGSASVTSMLEDMQRLCECWSRRSNWILIPSWPHFFDIAPDWAL